MSWPRFAIFCLTAVLFSVAISQTLPTARWVESRQERLRTPKDNVELPKLRLRGSALKKFFGIPIVAVSLYLPGDLSSDLVLSDVSKRLDVIYQQNIPKKELVKATVTGIKNNVSASEYAALQERILAINDKYSDVKKGDKITVYYRPETGLHFYFNQEDRGLVPGKDLGRAFFAIWVGSRPVDVGVKNYLLGQ